HWRGTGTSVKLSKLMPVRLTPEERLLRLCLRSPSAQRDAELGALLAQVSPELLVERAREHGVTAKLGAALGALDYVPETLVQVVAESKQLWAGRALDSARQLLKAVEALKAQKIPVLAFKGPLLAQQVYGAPGEREFLDLDLLVHPSDVDRAVEALKPLG